MKLSGVIVTLVLFFLALAVPAFGQHPGHGGQSHPPQGNHQQGNHTQARPEGHFHGDGGRHTSGESRGHYDGHHFDSDWHGRYAGRDHFFRVGRPVYYGGGWRFWYGGFWFGYDAWPYGWGYDDDVYVDYDGDVYYLCNPYHPGVRIVIRVF